MTADDSNQATPNPGRSSEPGTTIRNLNKLVSTNAEAPNSDTGVTAVIAKALTFARNKVAEAWSPTNPFRGQSGDGLEMPADAMPVDGRREEANGCVRQDASERLDKAAFIDGMSM